MTVLLPGTTMLLAATTGMSLVISSTPADRWLDPRWQVHALAAGLAFLFYLVLGAIGAAWSRHVGGSPGERLAAGAFPLVLHVAMAGPAVGADMLYAFSRGPGGDGHQLLQHDPSHAGGARDGAVAWRAALRPETRTPGRAVAVSRHSGNSTEALQASSVSRRPVASASSLDPDAPRHCARLSGNGGQGGKSAAGRQATR